MNLKKIKDSLKKEFKTGDIVKQGGKSYKKQPNGKWMEVSREGLTKIEYLDRVNEIQYKNSRVDNSDYSDTQRLIAQNNADAESYSDEARKLSSKEYTNTDLKINDASFDIIMQKQGSDVLEYFESSKKTADSENNNKDQKEEDIKSSMYDYVRSIRKKSPAKSSDEIYIDAARIVSKEQKISFKEILMMYTPSGNIKGGKSWDKEGNIIVTR